MKKKGNFGKNKAINGFNIKSKNYKPKSVTPKKINKIIHISKFLCPVENINTELKDMKKILNENDNPKEKEGKILIKNTNISITKENLIMSLRNELNFQKLLNKKLLCFKENAEKNSISYKKNYENICKYKKQLLLDLSDFLNLIDKYEKLKAEYEKENETIKKTNEDIIRYKKDEQFKMKNRLDKLNTDTQNQHNNIESLRNNLREYKEKNDEYVMNFEKSEVEHDKKYEALLKEYKRVENQYKYYLDLELRSRKNYLDSMDKNLCAEEEGLAVLKLSDKQVKGQFLKSIIKDIQSQIQDIENLNKRMEEDREIAKLLGKRGAEKFRKRMEEKYKNEITSINTKYNISLPSY